MLDRRQFGCRQGEGDHHQHQQRRGGEGQGPAVAAGQDEAPGADGQHGAAVAEGGGGGTGAPLLFGQQVCAVGVHQDVLGGTHQGQQNGHEADGRQAGRILAGPQKGHRPDHRHQQHLKYQ